MEYTFEDIIKMIKSSRNKVSSTTFFIYLSLDFERLSDVDFRRRIWRLKQIHPIIEVQLENIEIFKQIINDSPYKIDGIHVVYTTPDEPYPYNTEYFMKPSGLFSETDFLTGVLTKKEILP